MSMNIQNTGSAANSSFHGVSRAITIEGEKENYLKIKSSEVRSKMPFMRFLRGSYAKGLTISSERI